MKTYSVYEHVFPNGKRYIGITCEPKKRWNGGHGYDTQPKMKRAIQCYGWDNIEHNIICEGMPKEQAERLEMYLIDNSTPLTTVTTSVLVGRISTAITSMNMFFI